MTSVAGRGLRVEPAFSAPELFSEFAGRFVVATSDPDDLCTRARAQGVGAHVLGVVGGDEFQCGNDVRVDLATLRTRRESALEDALSALG